MKRRNFLSGLMAAPLALKARFARFFVGKRPVERCGAPIFGEFSTARHQQFYQLLAEGKSVKQARDILKTAPLTVDPLTLAPRKAGLHDPGCSLPRGHKGPHGLLLNGNASLCPVSR